MGLGSCTVSIFSCPAMATLARWALFLASLICDQTDGNHKFNLGSVHLKKAPQSLWHPQVKLRRKFMFTFSGTMMFNRNSEAAYSELLPELQPRPEVLVHTKMSASNWIPDRITVGYSSVAIRHVLNKEGGRGLVFFITKGKENSMS
ncbi:hypothetical protein L218DRAFT_984471 [Marasmius fiardii PR-910]|nr:hypothetical protein L218DRAFT_984471 [Marasmius fiardii PR-910]